MEIKACVFDIDGTLLPNGQGAPSARTVQAVRAIQQRGMKAIVATGRALFAAQPVLADIRPDAWVCVNGAHVTDGAGKTLFESTLTQEEMYALVDFCENYDLPLDFIYDDGYYIYVEYDYFREHYGPFQQNAGFLHDNEDQTRHLQGMPHGASALIPADRVRQFQAQYGHLGLRIVPFHEAHCDIMQRDVNKAASLGKLLRQMGIAWENTAVFGDGNNDLEMLQKAGLGVAMENGADALKAAAHRIAPPCIQDGVAQVLEQEILPLCSKSSAPQ